MDPNKDTDFIIQLDRKVTEGFSDNEEGHEAIMEALTVHDRRFAQAERAIQALEEGNVLLKELLLGSADGQTIGCRETQRDHASFLLGIKRGAWVTAASVTAAAIAWIVQVFNHVATQ